MTTNHPITTPLPELVQQWLGNYFGATCFTGEVSGVEFALATQAAQWGSDQELEACIELLKADGYTAAHADYVKDLCAARRPRPLSLKELALKTVNEMSDCMSAGFVPKRSDLDAIRRALEALPE